MTRIEYGRRRVLQTVGVVSILGTAGCLGGGDGDGDDDESSNRDDDGGSASEGTGDDGGSTNGGRSSGSDRIAEITFLGETWTFETVSCAGASTYPLENEAIQYRNLDEAFQFRVERHDPAESDVVEVSLRFPESLGQLAGEIETYEGETTIDEIEFELDSHTSGSLHLDPGPNMNDDVEHDPDGGVVEWNFSC